MKTFLTSGLLEIGQEKKALLITGGTPPSKGLLLRARERYPEVPLYCADSGANAVVAAELIPDAVLGDMDSIDPQARARLKEWRVPETVLPTHKNETDTHLALKTIFEQGIQEVLVLGATGTRMDHVLTNCMLIVSFGRQGKSLVFWDDYNCIRYVDAGKYQIPAADAAISLVPMDVRGMRLTLEGFQYPLQNVLEPYGFSRLISNEWTGEVGTIVVHSGDGFLCVSKDTVIEEENRQ